MSKFQNWLQIISNFAIVGGLLLVGIQINQNTQFNRIDGIRRAQEALQQFNLTLMGENPSQALAKASVDPSSLTDEELLVISAYTEWWNQQDIKVQLLLDIEAAGLSLEQIESYWEFRATRLHGGNPVAAEAWRSWRSRYGDQLPLWAETINKHFEQISEYNQDAIYLGKLREAANSGGSM